MFSSFWILANNSCMQVPIGHTIVEGKIMSADRKEIALGPIQLVRRPHMLPAAFLTSAMSIAATGAWYLVRYYVFLAKPAWIVVRHLAERKGAP
jgi:cytochrome d ubiquinol oxidase subunit I